MICAHLNSGFCRCSFSTCAVPDPCAVLFYISHFPVCWRSCLCRWGDEHQSTVIFTVQKQLHGLPFACALGGSAAREEQRSPRAWLCWSQGMHCWPGDRRATSSVCRLPAAAVFAPGPAVPARSLALLLLKPAQLFGLPHFKPLPENTLGCTASGGAAHDPSLSQDHLFRPQGWQNSSDADQSVAGTRAEDTLNC